MDDVCIFYSHLVNFMAIWYMLWPFSLFCGHLVYFPPIRYVAPRVIWQPWRVLSLSKYPFEDGSE
jgi:hypothetical protein